MKKRRLKKWVKNVITILLSIIIYICLGMLGSNPDKNIYFLIIGWSYLIFIVPIILYFINDEGDVNI